MISVEQGQVLAGKYRVDRVLGEGGMGVVVAATHLELQEQVALKFMRPELCSNAEAVERFLREARAAVRLKSEHVARINDVGRLENSAPYIVMEYLEGRDLGLVLEERPFLPLEEACDYVLQACDAVAEAHALGIVHRDLKPANLFGTLRADGTPLIKVLDFGISKSNALHEEASKITSTKSMMGSPHYMAPEQLISARNVDERADIWSLGVILYQLTSGSVPFYGETLGELMAMSLQCEAPSLHALRPELPAEFVALVHECLQKDREMRCPSVAALAQGLACHAPPRSRGLADRISSTLASASSARHSRRALGAVSPQPFPAFSRPGFAPGFTPTPTDARLANGYSSRNLESGTLAASTKTAASRRHKAWPWVVSGVGVSVLLSAVGLVLIMKARSANAPRAASQLPPPSAPIEASPPRPEGSSSPSTSSSMAENAPHPTTVTSAQPSETPPVASSKTPPRTTRPQGKLPASNGGAPKSLLDDRN